MTSGSGGGHDFDIKSAKYVLSIVIMEIGIKAFKAAWWLALFNSISQVFSWTVTIVVARILDPADYGLMEMAIIFTGLAEIFCDLGLGSAIIQRLHYTKKELSSVYWFGLGIGVLIAACFFPISYLTALVFNDNRIIPLTQAISVVFIFNGMQIVPLSLLNKDLEFKKIGLMDMTSVLVSCGFMLIAVRLGAGVWTLAGGLIIRSLTKLILIYSISRWIPYIHYNFKEVKSYLKFGVIVAFSRSLFYTSDISDRFVLGRAWPASILGFYTLALNLSKLPTEKITVVINQVSYPAFSKLQNGKEEFKKFYLIVIKVTAALVIPLFVGGFLVSDEIINVLLGEKWMPMVFVFKFLCLTQIVTTLNAVNNFVHNAQGRPRWGLFYHGTLAAMMAISFYFAAQYGLNAMLVPWFTSYVVVCGSWIYITIRKIEISVSEYMANIYKSLLGTVLMSISVLGVSLLIGILFSKEENLIYLLISKIIVGILVYMVYLYLLERKLIYLLLKAAMGK